MTLSNCFAGVVASGCLTAVFAATTQVDANETACSTRTAKVARAAQLYWSANNDRLVPAVSDLKADCEDQQTFAKHLLPYHGDWVNYRCPADWAAESALNVDVCSREPQPPKSTAARLATWAQKSHRGYNHTMLAPIVLRSGVAGNTDPEPSRPVTVSEIANPLRTIMFADTSYEFNRSGAPAGAGYYLVDPPCMRGSNLARLMPLPKEMITYRWLGGWSLKSGSRYRYGYAYPWHSDKFLICMVDGGIQTLSMSQLTAGCEVKSNSGGPAFDLDAYMWDIVK